MWMILSVHVTAEGRRPTAPERRHPSPGADLAKSVYFLGGHTAFLWTAFTAKREVDTRVLSCQQLHYDVVTGYFCLTIFLHNNVDGFFK
jgi:hypothetical protein